MEENKAEDSGKCCQSEKCCQPKKCCCWVKVIGAIGLILIGWIIGFLMGSGGMCNKRGGMGMGAMTCPMSKASSCPMTEPSKP